MKGKYLVNRGVGPSPMMKVEVWRDNGHNIEPQGMFPYNPLWWEKQDEILKGQLGNSRYVSHTLEDALVKARAFYSSLDSTRAPSGTIVVGQRLD